MSIKQTRRSCVLIFPFYEPFQLLRTKPYDYSHPLKQVPGPVATLVVARPDFFQELTFRRGAISTWLQSLNENNSTDDVAIPDVVLDGLLGLASRLDGLIHVTAGSASGPHAASAAAASTMGMLQSEWSSPLSRKPLRFLRLECMPQELAMVYGAYAAALRQSALQRYSQELVATADAGASGEADDDGRAAAAAAAAGLQTALTAAVATLRRAAGVYGYLADELLPALGGVGAVAAGDRPLELLPAAARCMQQLSLAEAQAMVAAAAELKGLSPGTQRALHAGCVSLFRATAAAAQEVASAAPAKLPLSDRLLVRVLPAITSLHTARSHLCMARERRDALEMGEAEAACEEALRLLDSAAGCLDKRSDPEAWLEMIQAERATCSALRAAVQRDRLAITFQALPKQPPDAISNPAIRALPETFQPEVVMPPAPPTESRDKGGCAVM